MRSKEYVGALAMIAALLLLKIGSLIALYKASPNTSLYYRTRHVCTIINHDNDQYRISHQALAFPKRVSIFPVIKDNR